MKKKAFSNIKPNCLHLHFSNGNMVSTIWGSGSYSENHDYESPLGVLQTYQDFLSSNDVEIMFSCGEKLKKKILNKYNDGNADPIGYLSLDKWLEIVNLLSKETKK